MKIKFCLQTLFIQQTAFWCNNITTYPLDTARRSKSWDTCSYTNLLKRQIHLSSQDYLFNLLRSLQWMRIKKINHQMNFLPFCTSRLSWGVIAMWLARDWQWQPGKTDHHMKSLGRMFTWTCTNKSSIRSRLIGKHSLCGYRDNIWLVEPQCAPLHLSFPPVVGQLVKRGSSRVTRVSVAIHESQSLSIWNEDLSFPLIFKET